MWEIAYGPSWTILRHAKFCIYGRNHSLHQLKHTVAHPKKEMGAGKKKKKTYMKPMGIIP